MKSQRVIINDLAKEAAWWISISGGDRSVRSQVRAFDQFSRRLEHWLRFFYERPLAKPDKPRGRR